MTSIKKKVPTRRRMRREIMDAMRALYKVGAVDKDTLEETILRMSVTANLNPNEG